MSRDPGAATGGGGRRDDGRLALGGLLIVIGAISLGLQATGIEVARQLGGSGWTLFVIVPGLVLLGAALVFRDIGLGLAIAGSITTITGLLLLYQDQNDHYESWAYAWTLVAPGGVGVGMLIHGLRSRQGEVVANGLRLLAVTAVLFVVGLLFFESVFDEGRLPFQVGDAWPIILVAGGVLLVVFSLLGGRRPATPPREPPGG
jgi:hypothetical protein